VKRYLLIISLLITLIIPNLVSCSAPPVCLEAQINSDQKVIFRTQNGSPCNKPSNVTGLSVVSLTRDHQLWDLSATDVSKAPKLHTITYGEAPEGLLGDPAKALMPGEEILIYLTTTGNDARLEWKVPKK
jgi:hypothetical protein